MATSGNHGNGYVTATEAGRLAGIPGRTVRHWASHGKVGTIETKGGRLVLLRDVRHLASIVRPDTASVATIEPTALPAVLPSALPSVATLNGNHPATTDNEAASVAAALATELAAIRAERQSWQAERDALIARALHAEWEAAQLRPLTAPPDLPEPKRRKRWWPGRG